uniref:Putative RNA exonuclease pqe-1 n=1 Tax=Anthurium amnicola TaxID=1678845 RepID=A0A1D1Z364_9ARAE
MDLDLDVVQVWGSPHGANPPHRTHEPEPPHPRGLHLQRHPQRLLLPGEAVLHHQAAELRGPTDGQGLAEEQAGRGHRLQGRGVDLHGGAHPVEGGPIQLQPAEVAVADLEAAALDLAAGHGQGFQEGALRGGVPTVEGDGGEDQGLEGGEGAESGGVEAAGEQP